MFQAYQSVKVVNEELEHFGQVGAVVELEGEDGTVGVKIDLDGEIYQFAPADVRGL